MTTDSPDAPPLHRQIQYLDEALKQNPVAQAALAVGADLALPDWYLGAGGVAQTVWNLRHGFNPGGGIKDYDLVYFDPDDLSPEAEARVEAGVASRLSGFDVRVDTKNQARVHLWYEQRLGRQIQAYMSTEEAIATWPTTASSIGVRHNHDELVVCAPFGLADLLTMVVRPNKTIVARDVYEEKASRWKARWPMLQIIPWSNSDPPFGGLADAGEGELSLTPRSSGTPTCSIRVVHPGRSGWARRSASLGQSV